MTERGETTRIAGILVVVWPLIGALAAGQRGYFGGSDTSCAKAGTACTLPQPSK